MPVKSEILCPADGETCGLGVYRICGLAWAGESEVAGVDVSVDGGRTWQAARRAITKSSPALRRAQARSNLALTIGSEAGISSTSVVRRA